MTDKEKKSTMKGLATSDQADYYSWITSITVNGKIAYELKGEFLDDIHNNTFSVTNEEDAIEHIEYFLRIVDPIDLLNEGMINDNDESSNDGWRRWDSYDIGNHDQEEREYENKHEDEERSELSHDHDLSICTIKRFEMIKYSFGQDEEYVAVKENEYEDLTSTSEDACQAYQEIFRMMDEGWMVTRAE
uniref:Uncharacterized protein n=1 Tax=Tanacetum cinerariifolium TaxID=118510 RepID=A0A699HE86_TANCI|nr:hypothetical protein [Tanacetum cinerariifolium]